MSPKRLALIIGVSTAIVVSAVVLLYGMCAHYG